MARRRAWAEDPGDGLDGGGELEPGAVVADGSAAPQVAWAAATGPSTASRAPAAALAAAPAVAMPTWSEPPTARRRRRPGVAAPEDHGPPDPPGRLEGARPRVRRPPRQARPVDRRRARRRRRSASGCSASPSRTRCTSTRSTTPGRRRSSCRTGATALPRHLRVDPSAPREVRDGRRHRRVGRRPGQRDERPRRAGPRRDHRAAPRHPAPDRRPWRRSRLRRDGHASSARTTCSTASLVDTAPIPGASSLAYDDVGYRLFIGTDDGEILVFDASGLDGVTSPELAALVAPPSAFGHVDGGIAQLYASGDGRTLLVATKDGRLVTLDADSAETIGDVELDRDQGVRAGRHGSGRRDAGGRGRGPGGRRGGPRRPPRRRRGDLRGAPEGDRRRDDRRRHRRARPEGEHRRRDRRRPPGRPRGPGRAARRDRRRRRA